MLNITASALTSGDLEKRIHYRIGGDDTGEWIIGWLKSVSFQNQMMVPDDPSSVRLRVTVLVYGNTLGRVNRFFSQVLNQDTPIQIEG